MKEFIARHGRKITGVLSGFDRLILRGTLRQLAHVSGLGSVMGVEGVLLKEFGAWAMDLTDRLKAAIDAFVGASNRPYHYLRSSQISKEDFVRELMRQHPVESGLVCVLSAVEPCQSFEIQRDRAAKKLRLRSVMRKCQHFYWYVLHPRYGLLHVRMQSWLPFTVHVCLNGRAWLAQQMDAAGIAYERADNCFPWIEDLERTQELINEQLRTDWPSMLESILASVQPMHGKLLRKVRVPYYWSTHQAEWATDVLFEDSNYLSQICPLLIQHAMVCLNSRDILRFLSKSPSGPLAAQVTSSFKKRHEGVRIKHSVNSNSVKLYDKTSSLLRAETTINQPRNLRAWRPKEGDPGGPCSWRPLRKGVADLYRLSQLCQASNERYLDALSHAHTDDPEPLCQALATITRPTTLAGRRVRALRPLHEDDGRLIEAIAHGEFDVTGFRNRDLLSLLYQHRKRTKDQARRLSARVSRLLRILRAHGLIKKVQGSHRYLTTSRGRRLAAAITGARNITLGRLQQALADAA